MYINGELWRVGPCWRCVAKETKAPVTERFTPLIRERAARNEEKGR